MPGLFFNYQNTSIFTQTASFHHPIYGTTTHPFEKFFVTQIFQSKLGFSYYHHPKGIRVWIYGAIYGIHIHTSFSESICEMYLHEGEKFINNLNGEYNIILYDENQNKILILNDRFAIRPWYKYQTKDGFCLSPDLDSLLDYKKIQPEFNAEIGYGFLSFNKMRLGDQTLLKGINVLPAATLLKINLANGEFNEKSYWTFRYNDEISNQEVSTGVINDLVETYRHAMNERANTWQDSSVGISLSGGLDSRTMVAALNDENLHNLSTHTFGLVESDEVRLAVEVAAKAGIKQTTYPLNASDYIEYAEQILSVTPELDIFVQAAQQKFLNQAKHNIDVLMTGIDLDVTLGGIYLEPEIMAAKNLDEIFSLIKKKNIVFSDDDLKQGLHFSFYQQHHEAVNEFAFQLLKSLPQAHPAASYDLFINQYSMRRIIMLRYAQIRSVLETASPMYDYQFIEIVRQIPLDQRAKHASFIPFLEKLSPTLSQIVYQRTMLPANAPRKFWRDSEVIENQKEKLYLQIWKETNGKINIPCRRYYTGFDEGLRLEPEWMNFTNQLLNDPQSRLYGMEIANPKFVQTMITEHQHGIRSHRQRLIILMSLELFLRKHFK